MKRIAALLGLVIVMTCKTATNQPPQIGSLIASPDTVAVSGTSVLKVTASDPESDTVSFLWQAAAGSLSATAGDSVVWTAPSVEGIYAVSVVAGDGHSSDAKNVAISVGKVPRFQVSGYAHYTETWWPGLPVGHLVQLMSDPLVATATVTVGGQQVPPYPQPTIHARTFSDTVRPTPGTAQALSIQSNLGNCTATCSVPGGFAFLTPTSESLPVGTTLVMSWTASSSAGWYQVYINYTWYDTMYVAKDTVFIVTAASAAVPGTWFTKDGWAFVYVYAGNGPSPAAGANAPGNVSGDAKGYWIGLNSVEKDIIVGSGDHGQFMARPDPNAPIRRLMESYQAR
jgi:hypothetical protein